MLWRGSAREEIPELSLGVKQQDQRSIINSNAFMKQQKNLRSLLKFQMMTITV